MGGESTAVCMTRNQAGNMLLELLQIEGISTLPVHIDGPIRENVHIYEESTGKQYRFDMPGATVKKEEWQSCPYILEKMNPAPDYMVVSGSLPSGVLGDFYARLARGMREAGTRVIVDSSGESLEAAVAGGSISDKTESQGTTASSWLPNQQRRRAATCGRGYHWLQGM
jgi:6-phosphofructokinase 2